MVSRLCPVLHLAQPLMCALRRLADHLRKVFIIHKIGTGAGGQITAVLHQLHPSDIDLPVAFHGVFDGCPGFGKGRRIQNHQIIGLACFCQPGQLVEHICRPEMYGVLQPVEHGVGSRLLHCVFRVEQTENGYRIYYKDTFADCRKCIISVGRVGSKWMEQICQDLDIPTKSNRVDLGVRVELPAVIFSHLTDELYESKIVYRTEKFEDNVRTFCMNPHGIVVTENTNHIVTVNGHSYEDPAHQTENTNFALLVAKHFSEPFRDSNGYGESIARLSNMLGGGVIVQRFGDLMRGRRSTVKRIQEGLVTPTLSATPGDLSLVLPKRILDGIIEMIYALDKIAPGTANDDTLLYGVEVKFYNMEVEIDENLESP